MQILTRRNFLELTAGSAVMSAVAGRALAAQGTGDVFTGDPYGGNVDSVIILGEEKAVLIDAQFNRANAERLADVIAATGRELETVFITHAHPDHTLGLSILLDRFPGARPLAHAPVQPGIAASVGPALQYMSKDDPSAWADRAIVPDALEADHIMLEGERIDILEPMHGDTALISPVYIPALDTLVAADLAFADSHLWLAENTTPEQIGEWKASLAKLGAIGAGTVIPGHRLESSSNDASVFAWTRDYLGAWEAALASTSNSADLKAAMLEGRDGLALGFALDRAVAAVYPDS